MGKTQAGNNNAYCHDTEMTWLDWDLGPRRESLLDFAAYMIRLRLREPVLQRLRFFRGARLWDSSLKALAWFRPDGQEMTEADWQKDYVRSLSFLLGGDAIETPDDRGMRIIGDTILVLMNAHHEPVPYRLPPIRWGAEWEILVDTAGEIEVKRPKIAAEGAVEVEPRSLVVLTRPATP
jgi:isoamylase